MSVTEALPTETIARRPSLFKKPLRNFGLVGLSLLLLLPVFGVIAGSVHTDSDSWSHLVATVLPGYVINTVSLLVIVAVLTTLMGTTSAWLVAATQFPGKRVLEWLLVLPIAAPAYIIAYVYTDLLEFAGPVQTALRALTGWEAGDYYSPPIRSLPGAGLMLALVLYPYVYLTARSAFLNHSRTQFAAARALGASPLRAFWKVALPAARPAILGGVVLAMMETAADFGVADYFGVSTFSTGIYRTWYGLGDEVSALRFAGMLLVIMAILVTMERAARKNAPTGYIARDELVKPMKLTGVYAWLATLACSLPVLLGFFIPVGTLVFLAIGEKGIASLSDFFVYARNSVSLSFLAVIITLVIAVFLAYAQRGRARNEHRKTIAFATRLATLGYALPGTLLAVGLLLPMTALDKSVSGWIEHNFGFGWGLILTGSVVTLVYAYTIRFLTVAFNTLEPAIEAIPMAMDEAARTLGANASTIVRRIHFPGLRPAIYSAGLLVFIDTMRELPATLLLRPFNFETLATRIYRLAADERLAEAAPAALALVAIGLIPVLLLNRVSKSNRH